MTIRHLRIFIAVNQEMSITKAAERLHLAQPSVSLAIKELEDNYKIKLFDRINRRIFITEEGKTFYEYASRIVGSFEEMENRMASPHLLTKLVLGSSITIGSYIVPELISRFMDTHEKCEIAVKIQNSKQIIRGVVHNEMDLGVVEDRVEHEQLICTPFMKDRLYFICRAGHPLSEKGQISLDELCQYAFYMREPGSAGREITDGLFKAYQLDYHIQMESVSNHSLLQALRYMNGITVMSKKIAEEYILRKELVTLPIYPDVFERNFSLIYHKKKCISSVLDELMKCFESLA